MAHQGDHQGAAGPLRVRRGEPAARLAARRRARARHPQLHRQGHAVAGLRRGFAGRAADRRDRQGRHRVSQRPAARARPHGVLRLRDARAGEGEATPDGVHHLDQREGDGRQIGRASCRGDWSADVCSSDLIVKGMLWQAFAADSPVVLLIDEIDKADIEFPNDLLRELDRMEFYVYETRELVKAKHRPMVFITSNNEKELPDAFLRRCFFHYIRFPDRETMERIVAVHFPALKKSLLREAMEVFFEVREVPGLKKKPSTSELLDWLKLLLAEDIAPDALRSKDRKTIIPPLHGALLKNEQDVHLFERLVFMTRAKGG